MENNKKVYLFSLGCDKNQVDAEVILGDLVQNGFTVTENPEQADLIVVNTCAFIEPAKVESIDAIFDALRLKKDKDVKVVVSGCLTQRYRQDLKEQIPEVDGFLGVGESILELLNFEVKGEKQRFLDGKPYAFLKISEGCDKGCTYCAIPGIRGSHKSKPPMEIFEEAKKLRLAGVSELILVAQDLTQYGNDLKGEVDLSWLLTRLSEDFDFPWIRLLYLYPEGIDENLLATMESHPNILPYFDIPIQHTNNRVLRAMGRGVTKERLKQKLDLIRSHFPEATLRSTVIVGFPGETESEFEELIKDLKEFEFDRLGAFAYSREEGTPAYDFKDQIDEPTKGLRVDEVSRVQHRIMEARNQRHVGEVMQAIIESEQTDGIYEARLATDAPEIDCALYLNSDKWLPIGSIVPVKIMGAYGYDFVGDLYEPTK